MFRFRDFVPPQEQLGLLGEPSLTTVREAVDAANNWIEAFHIDVLNMETLLLPGVKAKDDTVEAEFQTGDVVFWYQIVRVWYRENETVHTDQEIRVFDED